MKYIKPTVLVVLALVAGFLGGRACGGRRTGEEHPASAHLSQAAPQAEIWTCSMHPQIRQPKPGQCPLCGMDLIPVTSDSAATSDASRKLVLSPAARQLAEIAVAPVERRSVAVDIRLVGKVQADETRLAYIAPRVPGRIDRLYANFIGVSVKAGEHLADLYSPDLVSAQQELLQARSSPSGPSGSAALLTVIRDRLRLWGLTADQIAAIESSGQVRDHVTFYAPLGGIVVEKDVREGQYVEPGMRLFTVADLSQVWVVFDAYESDLAWLRYAQAVSFEVEAYPGETFKGLIAFINPLLDPLTRTVKVRVNVANPDRRLKPEMFVRGVVHAQVTGEGRVGNPDLQGKWISPMHPEIVKDGPGTCDICGMPLQRAADLGYTADPQAPDRLPLVIPATAPLLTGKRAVVYVALPEEGTYEGREVVLGPRAGDYFLVREGLQEGEQVVISGNFKIDSSLQIQGKPSMMAPEGGSAPVGHQHGEAPPAGRPETKAASPSIIAAPDAFRKQLGGVLDNVLATADALANDDLESSRASAVKAKQSLAMVDMSVLAGEAHERWMPSLNAMTLSLDKMVEAKDIVAFRIAFASLSPEMARVVKTFGPVRSEPVYDLRCPMAFNNRGASWLQKDKQIRNPYFGKAMPTCGEVTETILSAGNAPAEEGHAHE